jgi:hypothetical protein
MFPFNRGRDEYHVCRGLNGHESSTDCWCEPTRIKLSKMNGRECLVVHHNDTDAVPVSTTFDRVIEERSRRPDYVTRILDSINF